MRGRRYPVWSPGSAGPLLRLTAATDPHDVTWRDFASCATADGDFWYPESSQGTSRETRKAKDVCAGCPVSAQCLDFALTHMRDTHDYAMFGIWAGTTVEDRKRMLKEAA